MIRIEKPESVCDRFAPQIHAAMVAWDRLQLRYATDVGLLHITVGAKLNEKTLDESTDLPPALRVARASTRHVYRLLVRMWAQSPAPKRVQPATLMARHLLENPDGDEPSRHTFNHALYELRDLELAFQHPQRGWVLGREQPRLTDEEPGAPFSPRRSDEPSTTALVGYAARMAPDSRARSRGFAMETKRLIWVPMDEDGAVRDAKTDDPFPPGEKVEEMTYRDKAGRKKTVKATRGELLEVVEERGGELAKVRIGKHVIKTAILGKWHLAGELSPPAEPGTRSPWPAVSGS